MSESFREPHHELTMACQELNIEAPKISDHNCYLWKNKFEEILSGLKMKKQNPVIEENFLSTHFYMTRVFHRAFRPEGAKVKGKFFQQFMGQALSPGIGNFSPILFFSLAKA